MIADIRKGMDVLRFHTQQRLRSETVGHHTANLCAILLRLDPNCSRALLIRALMHDVPEQYTGDIPAPVKWRSESIKHSLAWEEQNFITKHKLPNPQLSQDEYDLLKAADMLDFTFSSIEEVRRGNTYAERLVSVGRTYIMGLPLPPAVLEKALAMIKEVQEYEDVGL